MKDVTVEIGFPENGNLLLLLNGKIAASFSPEEAKKLHANLGLAIRYLDAQTTADTLKSEIKGRQGFQL